MSLEHTLASTAERIAIHGTQSERNLLEDVAAMARSLRPGAAAALVDWDGPEIARLRAFGVVHGDLLRAGATITVHDIVHVPAGASTGRAA